MNFLAVEMERENKESEVGELLNHEMAAAAPELIQNPLVTAQPNNIRNDNPTSHVSQSFDLFSKYFHDKKRVNPQQQCNKETLGKAAIPRLNLAGSCNNSNDLFRQQSGFGSPIAVVAGIEERKSDLQGLQPPKCQFPCYPVFRPAGSTVPAKKCGSPQLTIFYAGMVNVYDDIPADKAQAIMLLASSGKSTHGNTASKKVVQNKNDSELKREATTVAGSGMYNNQPSRELQADLPIARKHSLRRFLEKRKDRVKAKGPYAATEENPKNFWNHVLAAT